MMIAQKMNKVILSIILVLSSCLPALVYAKWFSEPEEIFETERCLGAFIDGAKILNDRLVESKISNETRRLIDMAVRNDRGYPYILRFEYITDYNDLNDMDQIGGECYVIQLEGLRKVYFYKVKSVSLTNKPLSETIFTNKP